MVLLNNITQTDSRVGVMSLAVSEWEQWCLGCSAAPRLCIEEE